MIGALCLLGGLLAPAAAPAQDAAPAEVQEERDRYAELEAEYEQAHADWKARIAATSEVEALRELRANNPGKVYFPRFEPLAEEGEGRALLWCAAHVKDSGLVVKEQRPFVERALRTLVEEHAGAPWFTGVLDQIAREERALGAARTRELYERAVEHAQGDNQAQALIALARLHRASKVEGARAAALATYRRVLERFPETRYAEIARDDLFVIEHLSVGGLAPDFEAVDAEGRAVKLSDHRGKVVLLDFWAFWCPKCRGELPYMKQLVKRLEGEPFVLLGVNVDAEKEEYLAQRAEHGLTWRSVWDGGTNGPVTTLYRIPRFPTAYLIDAEGRIRATAPSAIAVSRQVDRVLAELKAGKRD